MGAKRQRLGRIHPGADAAGGDQRDAWQHAPHFQQRLRGRNAPLRQRGVPDFAVPDELLDAGPRRAARPGDVHSRDRAVRQFCGGSGPDAVADFLEHHRVADRSRDLPQPGHRTREVGVALVLHGFLQRIGMHRKGIGANVIERRDECRDRLFSQLRQPDIADEQNVGC